LLPAPAKYRLERSNTIIGNSAMEQLYTVQEVSIILKVGYRSVLQQINTGKLSAYLVAHSYRIPESSVMKFLDINKVQRVAV